MKYNSLLRERNIRRNAKKLDPILVEEIDSDDEWIAEVDDPIFPSDLSWLENDIFEVDAIRNVPIECYEQQLSTWVPIRVEPLEEPILNDEPILDGEPILDDELNLDDEPNLDDHNIHASYSPPSRRRNPNDDNSSKYQTSKNDLILLFNCFLSLVIENSN